MDTTHLVQFTNRHMMATLFVAHAQKVPVYGDMNGVHQTLTCSLKQIPYTEVLHPNSSQWLPLNDAPLDFRYLLSRGYPRTAALALVGNRYKLDHTARQLLHRGVFAPAAAAARRAKLRLLQDLAGQPLGIDGHNVLITLECAIRKLPLVAADDGFIRDVGQVSGAFRASPETEQALILLGDYLVLQEAGPVSVFYDAPLSLSGELARRTRELWAARGLAVQAAAVPVPERELLLGSGPIASSDTALIDQAQIVVDLAGEIIRRQGWSVIEPGS